MKGYRTHFNTFYNTKAETLVFSIKTKKALFRREVDVLFKAFKNYLEDRWVSHRGLTRKSFLRLLAMYNHFEISNKK